MGWWSRGQLWGIRILKEGKLQTVNENGLSWTVDLDGKMNTCWEDDKVGGQRIC